MKIEAPKRTFVEQDLKINSWDDISGYFDNLLARDINDKANFTNWLSDISELEAVLEEDLAWRYIRMTIDTRDEGLSKAYTIFVTEIQPKLSPMEDKLNRKMIESPYVKEFESDEAYAIMFRRIRTAVELYREENITLFAKLSEESQKFGAISGSQSIEHDGKRLTMQQASLLLKEQDESLRKLIFDKIADRRREDLEKFAALFDELLKLRQTVAVNAGFENFRDYKMKAMGRYDYDVEDCKNFHRSVKEIIVPIAKQINQKRLDLLGKEKFKPWDTSVDPEGKTPLKPFQTGKDLIEGTIKMMDKIDPYFADCLQTMNNMKHLDLESKEGKSPGGYNYPLYEIGVPFIFMNAVGSQRDLVTMVHEGGHAIHSFLSRDLSLTGFKNLTSEIAELASMSMELITMNEWDEFYNEEHHIRAKREHLEDIIKMLPWIAQIDEFQHWLYENHDHTSVERTNKWMELNKEYGTGLTDWTGYEDVLETSWQRQLHIFEVPFYYIEYGIAQLGAIAVWKNYIENPSSALDAYKAALKLAYTRSIPKVYETANIEFNFSKDYIGELSKFVQDQLKQLD